MRKIFLCSIISFKGRNYSSTISAHRVIGTPVLLARENPGEAKKALDLIGEKHFPYKEGWVRYTNVVEITKEQTLGVLFQSGVQLSEIVDFYSKQKPPTSPE